MQQVVSGRTLVEHNSSNMFVIENYSRIIDLDGKHAQSATNNAIRAASSTGFWHVQHKALSVLLAAPAAAAARSPIFPFMPHTILSWTFLGEVDEKHGMKGAE